MGVIFDLDQTLADTSLAAALRQNRNWPGVYKLVPRFTVYPGILDLIRELDARNIPMCIVTTSPAQYCNAVVTHHNIPIIHKVCYHDTSYRKPHPEPILKALQYLGVKPNMVFSVGDDAKDVIASNAAGVLSVAAMWGTLNKAELIQSKPKYVCNSVEELREIVLQSR